MSKAKFKVGDKVIVRKPSVDDKETWGCWWVSEIMDSFDGQEAVIASVDFNPHDPGYQPDYILEDLPGLSFCEDWLEKA